MISCHRSWGSQETSFILLPVLGRGVRENNKKRLRRPIYFVQNVNKNYVVDPFYFFTIKEALGCFYRNSLLLNVLHVIEALRFLFTDSYQS